ncbi:MAG TPA: VWA domain-containing protein [Pyrinomonadaceae bacterium]|nr:VWA domain-containing protein [Pyrinomonadaceae bacterium]
MKTRLVQASVSALILLAFCAVTLSPLSQTALAQSRTISSAPNTGVPGRPVTIPLTVKLKESDSTPELQMIDLTVIEDGEPQTILSTRAMGTNWPLTLAVLIQDDVVSSIGLEMRTIADFIRRLPRGSRVLVGYIRVGSLQVRQKFTTDLDKAARALRPPTGLAGMAPYNPYVEVVEALRRFESQPYGRRAILLVSDGLDLSRGVELSSSTQSIDLQRAINDAQRQSVAIYSFFAPTAGTLGNSAFNGNAQSALQRLTQETGGRAFFQGTGVPVSFDSFVRELNSSLERQIALTYLSTHTNKGFHRIEVRSSTPGVQVTYPPGYTSR